MTDVPIGARTLHGMHPGFLDRSVAGSLGFAGDSVAVSSMVLPLDRIIPPVALITATGRCVLSPVQFTVAARDTDGTIARYEWDFEDDGTTDYTSAVTGNTSHSYAAGTYLARLTVKDDDGAIGRHQRGHHRGGSLEHR